MYLHVEIPLTQQGLETLQNPDFPKEKLQWDSR